MEISKALLADYANIAEGGKLNVLGIFTAIYAHNFPVVHPQMKLIFMWEANRSEGGRIKDIEIELCDADGKKILGLRGKLGIIENPPGKRITGNQILTLNNVRFEKPCEYVFNILVGGEHKASVPFEVAQIQTKR